MAKYLDEEGLKKALGAVKEYTDGLIEETQSVASSALNELENISRYLMWEE